MIIKVLGTGCRKCEAQEKEVKAALQETGLEAAIQKVTDIDEIMEHVLVTPGLMIDGQVKASGKVAKKKDIIKWLKEA